jgi:hypothetical protein
MVIVDKDKRYYQRVDVTSVPMGEAEVARLYARRQKWETDGMLLLEQTIERNHALWAPDPGFGDLHVMIRPVVPDDTLLAHAVAGSNATNFFYNLLLPVEAVYRRPFAPQFSVGNGQPHEGGWRCGSSDAVQAHDRIVDLSITESGVGYLFCGRAACTNAPAELAAGRKRLMADLVAGLTTRACFVLGEVYAAAAFVGAVDVGVAVTGLKRFRIVRPQPDYLDGEPMQRTADYRRTARVTASELVDHPRKIARELVGRLIEQVGAGGETFWMPLETNR